MPRVYYLKNNITVFIHAPGYIHKSALVLDAHPLDPASSKPDGLNTAKGTMQVTCQLPVGIPWRLVGIRRLN